MPGKTVGAVLLALLGPGMSYAAGFAEPELAFIAAGPYITGSDRAEREAAYQLDEKAYGHSITRDQTWYERERARKIGKTEAYRITVTPITNRQYAAFVADTGHRVPDVDPATWAGYGLIHPYSRTRRHAWGCGTTWFVKVWRIECSTGIR